MDKTTAWRGQEELLISKIMVADKLIDGQDTNPISVPLVFTYLIAVDLLAF